MKRICSLFLMLVFSALSLLAQDAIRYISYADGRVYAIPEKHISYQQEENGVVTLTLEGGNTFTYNVSEVEVSDYFASNLEATLTKYAFTNADNDQVYADVNATITKDGDRIVVNADVPVIGKRLRPSFELSEGVSLWLGAEKQQSGVSSHRFEEPIVFTLAPENHLMYTVESESNGFVPFGRECEVNVKYLTDYATGTYKIPTVYITFGEDTTKWDADQWIGMEFYDEDGNYIWTKEEWIENCTFQLDGAGVWPDIAKVEGCEVRGRGNSSWYQSYMSKNPFRIKFPKKKKQSPFNLTEDRQWVFIANKQNGSMTSNSIAQKVAAMVDAEALCHMIPVDVYINGHYRGSYCFTEKIGIADNSVAIDEATGCLLELDDYFDETFRFKDPTYDLPVNVKDPDFSEEDEERVVTFEAIQNSFNTLTATLHAGGDIASKIDMESWAKFWLVNDLVRNVETHHPKSCYLFNENLVEGEKWKFGPAWDFDWAFGYEDQQTYFIAGAEEDLFSRAAGQNKAGYQFYNALRKSQAGRKAYQEEWNKFMEEDRLGELMEYIDDYTEFASLSIQHNNDADVSEKNYTDYEYLAERSKNWLTRRANYIYNSIQSGDTPDEGEVTPQIFLVDGIRYSVLSNSEVEVTGLENDIVDNITIPATIEYNNVTYTVTRIGESAFSNCSGLTSVTIPNSVESIGASAFNGCSGLTSVTIPNSVESIGAWAFNGCSGLTSVHISDIVSWFNIRHDYYSNPLFYAHHLYLNGEEVKDLVIPNSVTIVGYAAFDGCSGLTSVTFHNGVTSIDTYAFYGCSGLTSIALPNSLTYIGNNAFKYCEMLSDVTSLSDNITIGSDCFAYISQNAVLRVPIGTKSRYISNEWGEYFSNILEDGVPNEVITNKCVKIGTAQSSMTPNTWYFVHNTRIAGIEITTNFSEPGETIKDYGGLVSDCGLGNEVRMSETSVISALKSEALPNMERRLVRFVPVEGKDDAFRVEFATGNWLKAISESHQSHFTVTPNAEEATIFNFYLIDGNEHGRFGWNVYDMQNRVDNDGAGNTLSLWEYGELIGVTEGNNVWQIYDVVEGNIEVTMVDGAVRNYTNDSEQDCDKLTYIRTLPNKQWNPLYIPFKIPYEKLADNYDVAYINSMHSYDNDQDGEIEKMTMEVIKIKKGILKANQPYLIRAKNEAAKEMNLLLEDAILYPTVSDTLDCSSVYTHFKITGTYDAMTREDLGESLVITTDGAWKKLATTSILKPFRFYLTITSRDGSPYEVSEEAKSRINICVQGEDDFATGIDERKTENGKVKTDMYDLTGRRLQNAQKGIYIVNGKKVVK